MMNDNRHTPRRAWQRPAVTRIATSAASFGATPLVPEGAFGSGS